MRIIAGEKRGCALSPPRDPHVRPTLDRVKESLFGMLQFDLAGRRVLDLFAGSGGLGLEALSRGARCAAFCDNSKASLAAVRDNITKLGYGDRARVYACRWETAVSAMAERGERFDLVFLDPPYASGLTEKAADTLYKSGLLSPGFIIAAERDAGSGPGEIQGLETYRERRYGRIAVALMRRKEP